MRQEIADGGRDLGGMGFQREMAGVEEAHDRLRHVALERLGARRQEERIVLAPHRQEGRLVGAEIVLEGRIERDIALVVAKQVELHFVGAGPGQVEIVERVAVRRDRVASGTPCVYCQTVVSGFSKARSASRLAGDGSCQ